jgi:hypothetical protein
VGYRRPGFLAVTTTKIRQVGNRARAARANGRAADLAPIIAELQAAGITTLRAIAAALNDRRVPTVNGYGAWRSEQVSRLLRRLNETVG